MNKKISSALIVSILVASLGIISNTTNVYADKKECYDFKYEDGKKMPGTSHDDNKQSESRSMKMIFEDDATLCEIADCYDADRCGGELTGNDLKKFYKSVAFETGDDEQQKCLKHRGNLPDDGEKALQLYEIYDCAVDHYGNA